MRDKGPKFFGSWPVAVITLAALAALGLIIERLIPKGADADVPLALLGGLCGFGGVVIGILLSSFFFSTDARWADDRTKTLAVNLEHSRQRADLNASALTIVMGSLDPVEAKRLRDSDDVVRRALGSKELPPEDLP